MSGGQGAGQLFDPRIDYSPFRLYAALRRGAPPPLVDVRSGRRRSTLRSALRTVEGELPPEVAGERLVVLFDEDGEQARRRAVQLQGRGRAGVRALFGGLELWRLCFQEWVVGETFLVEAPEAD